MVASCRARDRRDAVDRGEDEPLHAVELDRDRQGLDGEDRRRHRAEAAREPRVERGGEGRGLRFGPDEQDGPRVGHGSPRRAAVAPRPGGCYLRGPSRATRGCPRDAMPGERLILGIESSCDDTAVAVVRARPGVPVGSILASEVAGQAALHDPYGGVVPEIAARAHAERLDGVTERALAGAGVGLVRHRRRRRHRRTRADRRRARGRDVRQGRRGRARPAALGDQPPGRPRADPAAGGAAGLPVPDAAGLGRALPVPRGRRAGELPAARRHHRRRPRRGLRQGGEAHRPAAARRPVGRGRGGGRRRRAGSRCRGRSSTATAATCRSPA